jgi:ribonuclease HI
MPMDSIDISNRENNDMAATPSEKHIIAGTDGSSLGNPGPAGWAWYVNQSSWAAGGMANGTNQQAELFAVLALLRAVPRDYSILIRTDSQYALKSCTQWMATWKKNGWKKSDGSLVSNLDLMKEIDLSLSNRIADTKMEWVRGHIGDFLNEKADSLCNAASAAIQKGVKLNTGPGWNLVKVDDNLSNSFRVNPLKPNPFRSNSFNSPESMANLDRPDLIPPKEGVMCPSCDAPINPYSLECRCSR